MARATELRLPSDSPRTQLRNKEAWNEQRPKAFADFYTIGYSGRGIKDFLAALAEVAVQCLIDIRHTPISMYKPDFSKSNLQRYLNNAGIAYLHLPELGVPRDIRSKAIGKMDRNDIWAWYDAYITPQFGAANLHRFFNITEHPVAFMCTELDPTSCHRHRLALALEKSGLKGSDI